MYKRSLLALLILVWGVAYWSCSEDSPTQGNARLESQFETTEDLTEMTTEVFTQSTRAVSMADLLASVGTGKVTTPGDTLFPGLFTCPYIIWEPGTGVYVLDYGDGCQDLGGTQHSGKIQIEIEGDPKTSATITVTFLNYSVDGSEIDGSLLLTVSGDSIQYTMDGTTIRNDEGTFTLTANLTIVSELNTPDTIDDDVYQVTGLLSVSEETSGANFVITILEAVRIEGDCEYPTQGVVEVSGSDETGPFEATVDYFPENGACDAIAEVTVGQVTRTINLDE